MRTMLVALAFALSAWSSPGQADDVQFLVRWDKMSDNWKGPQILNTGSEPFAIRKIIINNREECTALPIDPSIQYLDPEKERGPYDVNFMLMATAVRVTGSRSLFVDKGAFTYHDPLPEVALNVGDTALIIGAMKCPTIVSMSVVTDRGTYSLKLDTPYN